jgi:RNA polymerase sigma-70 factor (ECF subfamily)
LCKLAERGALTIRPPRTISETFLSIRPRLARFIARRAFTKDEVEDLIQDTFLSAHRAKGEEPLDRPQAYLYRVARTVCYKSNKRRADFLARTMEDIDVDALTHDRPGGVEVVEDRELLGKLLAFASTLPPRPKEVFVMRHIEGLTYKEIAARIGIAESTVEKHVAKATLLCAQEMRRLRAEGGGGDPQEKAAST